MSTPWDTTYTHKSPAQRSWTEGIPQESLRFIDASGVGPDDAVIDIGAGSARLVDELKRRRFTDVSVLDVSSVALQEVRSRLGDANVHWINADVTRWKPERSYRLWHDRAVFHFLVESEQQSAYVQIVSDCVEPGGFLVMGTFAPDGPDTCSGLEVRRWSIEELSSLFDGGFDLVRGEYKDHLTPWAAVQPFTWVMLQRRLT
ncbi:MAG: class I SAM-dependent methyltransferase [Acidimicrobiaceae bacterium]|nr:class I SAM-dependent methyltransferase [Acidimicrobiaceae bacterium]